MITIGKEKRADNGWLGSGVDCSRELMIDTLLIVVGATSVFIDEREIWIVTDELVIFLPSRSVCWWRPSIAVSMLAASFHRDRRFFHRGWYSSIAVNIQGPSIAVHLSEAAFECCPHVWA